MLFIMDVGTGVRLLFVLFRTSGEPTEINESLRMQSEYTGVTGEKSKLPEITLRH